MIFTFQSRGNNDIYTIRSGSVDMRTGAVTDAGDRVKFQNGAYSTSKKEMAFKIMHLDAFAAGRIVLVAIDGELPSDEKVKSIFKDMGPVPTVGNTIEKTPDKEKKIAIHAAKNTTSHAAKNTSSSGENKRKAE